MRKRISSGKSVLSHGKGNDVYNKTKVYKKFSNFSYGKGKNGQH